MPIIENTHDVVIFRILLHPILPIWYNRSMELIKGLNPQQQQAMTAGNGPILVLAGPGSGKTRVLTQRIAYIISHLGVRPFNIMAVTFTNKAARQMKERVEAILGAQASGIWLGTFHAICARMLRREAEHLPFDNNFVIFDQDDQRTLVKQAIKELNLDDKTYRPIAVHNAISRAKNELILPDNYPLQTYRDEAVQRVYQRYQQLLLNNNALDFDDLLLSTASLLEGNPEVRQKYARRFEHILVDEFQDTNVAQYLLLKHLASHHRNLFVVGDVDQSIYRWRGADYRNVHRFESDFPDASTILLEQNYRSTQNILDTAMAVIDRNPGRTRKELFTERGAGDKIVLQETFNGREESEYVVDSIAQLVLQKDISPGDFAIMYRTNAQSRLLEEAFLHANLPYKLVGAQRFYGRREVKDLLAYLRLVHNPNDEASLVRVINTPRRKIGDKTLNDLRRLALNENTNMGTVLLNLAPGEESDYYGVFNTVSARSLSFFGLLLRGWRALAGELTPLALLDRIMNEIDYHSYLEDGSEEGIDRWDNVLELRRLAAEYDQKNLAEFLQDVALVSDQDTIQENAAVPTLLTLHAAKGLEFPIVFIVGLEDGTLPHIRSFDEAEEMAEERRLLYVGITRAKNQLFLVYALNRSTYGYSEPTIPSRFLEDIPNELIEGGNPLAYRHSVQQRTHQQITTWDKASAPIIQPNYHAGQNVHHATYGEGMVLNAIVEDGEEIVDVFFDGVGMKKLVASLASLTLLD